MRYYNYDNDEYATKRAEADRRLRETGRVRNEYGSYSDPDKPWRTEAHIRADGRIDYDM